LCYIAQVRPAKTRTERRRISQSLVRDSGSATLSSPFPQSRRQFDTRYVEHEIEDEGGRKREQHIPELNAVLIRRK
jgi:hypothetical protein